MISSGTFIEEKGMTFYEIPLNLYRSQKNKGNL